MTDGVPRESFTTLTHARLRVAQGDTAGALRILEAILEVEPGHLEASRLAVELAGRPSAPHASEAGPAVPPAVPGRPAELAGRFRDALDGRTPPSKDERRERLSAYLVRVVARRGGRRDG